MFTRRVFTFAITSSSYINPVLWRNFCTKFEPIRIKNIGTHNVSYHDIINANVTLVKHKIDIHLASKEIQEIINLDNVLSNGLSTSITPLFMLNNNGIMIDGPKDINRRNQLETIFSKTKIPELIINFRYIEKTTNGNNGQWYVYYNITSDFSNYWIDDMEIIKPDINKKKIKGLIAELEKELHIL